MIFNIEVNNKTIRAKKGDTILTTLEENGIKLPTLCFMKNFTPTGSCRMCVVEVEGKSELIPSCSHPVEEWMKIKTHSPRVIKARKVIVELLLANHPDDCLYCERNRNCELQNFSEELNIRERRFMGKKNRRPIDNSSPGITRDLEKCILCGRCIRTCEEKIGVSAIDFNGRGNLSTIGAGMGQSLNLSACINCGQCIMVCPTGALLEKTHTAELNDMLHKPNISVIAQISQTVAYSLGEEFGIKPGKDIGGLLVAALRRTGFARIFETSFACDVYVLALAGLLKQRMEDGGLFPLISSDCPAWIMFAEKNFPEFLPNIAPVKSPQQITGSIVKDIFSESSALRREQIYQVSIMPCTAKKFEAQREELTHKGISDVDAVLTTREIARFIRLNGIDLNRLEPEKPDSPYFSTTSSGQLMGFAGGLTEAVLRTYFHLIGNDSADVQRFPELRNSKVSAGIKIKKGDAELGVAVANGLIQARQILTEIKKGRNDIHFIEIMACPGGCASGGGQKIGCDDKSLKCRIKGLQDADESTSFRQAFKNHEALKLLEQLRHINKESDQMNLLETNFTRRES
jgi:iron-only hydrogenase group A